MGSQLGIQTTLGLRIMDVSTPLAPVSGPLFLGAPTVTTNSAPGATVAQGRRGVSVL